MIQGFFILWYGIIWGDPESTGFFVATDIFKSLLGRRLDSYNPNPEDWWSPIKVLPKKEPLTTDVAETVTTTS